MTWKTGWVIAIALVVAACDAPVTEEPNLAESEASEADQKLFEQAQMRFSPLPEVAESAGNPLTAEKIELGRKLYLDPRLSKDGNVSCDSCHSLASFGVDNLPFSPGDGGELGGRNSPTVLNAALHVAQFWDGRAADVETQAGMPIMNPVEMAIPSEEFLVDRLSEIEEYREAFGRAFAAADPPLSYANIRRALAAFERTLLTPSRFDDYLRGDLEALTAAEKDGLRVFISAGCSACHNGVTLGGASFRKFGLHEGYWEHTGSEAVDEGRFGVTQDPADRFVFKVASLRNVARTGPYFHDGSVAELEDAVRIMLRVQLGREAEAIEADAIASFLESLTGEVPAAPAWEPAG